MQFGALSLAQERVFNIGCRLDSLLYILYYSLTNATYDLYYCLYSVLVLFSEMTSYSSKVFHLFNDMYSLDGSS